MKLYETEGKLVSCQRKSCDTHVFMKYFSFHSPNDDGYNDLPEGWEDFGDRVGMLCPQCAKEYKDLLFEFNLARPEGGADRKILTPHLDT